MLDASCSHCGTPITDRTTQVEVGGKTFCCRNCVAISAGTSFLPDAPTCAHCRLSIVDTSTLARRGELTFCCTNCATAMTAGAGGARV